MSIYLGNTPLANTGYDKANIDLSNLTSTGKNIANWSNNVTNCITEIPQDIKLELNNGTLTLKAGSKVYVPNGFESDGTTPKFDEVIITNDKFLGKPLNTQIYVCSYCLTTETIDYTETRDCSSGSSPSGSQYNLFYNTVDNTCKRTDDTGSSWRPNTFPFCIVTVDNNLGVTSIDQVFNGFGYIGNTVFALPGVKGLIPNGRNTDGSLKNIEFTIDSVKTATRTWVDGDSRQIWGYIKNPPTGAAETWYWNEYVESDEEPSSNDYTMWYKPSENIIYMNNGAQSSTPNWEKVNYINFGKASGINSQEIKIFTPKTAFHALDYNDSSTISSWGMPSSRYIDLTLLASGSTYTAPANGWFTLAISTGIAYLDIYTSIGFGTNGINLNNNFIRRYIPVHKGEVLTVFYLGTPTVDLFRFIYAEGEV